MTSPVDLKWLSEQRRFVEVMYFGARLEHPTALERLYLGLACCASIRPVAEVERMLAASVEGRPLPAHTTGLIVGRGTRLVHEGVMHIVRVTREEPALAFPSSSREAVADVIADLMDYARQDFKAFPAPELGYSLKTVAYAAIVLLHRLAGTAPILDVGQVRVAENLIQELQAVPAR
jgi:hypothetical protein